MIEHNLDVLLQADHIIDLGPEGGDKGGRVIVTGTPEQIAACPDSYTGIYIREMLDRNKKRRVARTRQT
jgi:excinuclease ABC subunit A